MNVDLKGDSGRESFDKEVEKYFRSGGKVVGVECGFEFILDVLSSTSKGEI